MYCYEKPRTEDKTRVHKSFSLSTTQSLPDVAQRRFVGWDSEELSGNPQPKIGNLSGYSVSNIRIHYSLSEPVSNGIRMNDNSRLKREAGMEDQGSDLSGTARLSTKSETGQPIIQFQLPEDVKDKIVQELKQKMMNKEKPFTKPVDLPKTVQKWIKNIRGNTWSDAVEIARRLKDEVERETELQKINQETELQKINQETELQDEPPKPERISLNGYEVSFVGEELAWFSQIYQEYKKYIDPIVSQPFEGRFTDTNNQIYYHIEGAQRGREDAKPIWQVVEYTNNKVTIKLVGLYRHTGNGNKNYKMHVDFSEDGAPSSITIK